MATITSAGIGSNLDVEGLVSQLMAFERQPLTKLALKETSYQAKLSAFGTLKSSLTEFQTAARALSTPDKMSPLKSSVGDATILSASGAAGAVAGTYDIEVKQLAQSQKLITTKEFSATTDPVGTGKLTIAFGSYAGSAFTPDGGKAALDITIDSSNNTLAGLRDAINASNGGVTASIINDGKGYHLSLTSKTTGEASAMQISAAPPEGSDAPATTTLSAFAYHGTKGVDGSSMRQTAAAQDALIVVDSVEISKPSNTITDAIQGVTLNLSKTTADGVTTKLGLTRDTSSVQTAIEAFVKSYNALSKSMTESTAFDVATGKAAVLNGDSTVRSIQTQLRGILGGVIPGAARGSSTLPDIGITTQRDGSLAIDSTKLSAALNDPTRDMSALFASSGTNKGFASQIDAAVGRILSPVGTLPTHTNSFTASIKDIDKQRATLSTRLAATEQRYRAQFAALDKTISSMTTTSKYLTQQLASLANM